MSLQKFNSRPKLNSEQFIRRGYIAEYTVGFIIGVFQ
jgi:hypothetical protein